MQACYYPTSLVFVDDDERFLEDISHYYEDRWACHVFTTPQEALEYMQNEDRQAHLAFSCPIDMRKSRNIAALKDKLLPPPTSVIVVDYTMPVMNGLELCERLSETGVERLMLTGDTDAETAVMAFNRGAIEQFMLKTSLELLKELTSKLKKLEMRYFYEQSRKLLRRAPAARMPFLESEQFQAYFQEFVKREKIKAYFISCFPQGFLCFDREDQVRFFLVQQQEDLQTHAQVAEEHAAPEALKQQLSRGENVVFFPTDDGFYDLEYEQSWQRCVAPAKLLDDTWYCGLTAVQG